MSEAYDSTKPIGTFSAIQTYHTYSWINNEQFYSLVPYPYRDYYFRFIKKFFYWYDGFVPYFHNSQSGMMSSRLAYTIIHKLAQQTVGNKLMFDDEGIEDKNSITINNVEMNSLEFIEYWSDLNTLDTKVVLAEEWAMAGGDSAIKLDSDGKNLIPSVLRKDTYFFDTDFRGEVTNWSGLIYTYSKMTKQDKNNPEPQYFYLLEDRRYNDNGVPQVRLSIKRGSGNLANSKQVDMSPETIPFSRLPRDISHKFKKNYPNTELGKWQDLPLKDIGVYIIKASENVTFLPGIPGGESILSNCIHSLMSYDFYYSSMLSNIYVAKDKLIVPQHMQAPNGQLNPYSGNYFSGWDSFIQTKIPYTNPEDAKPIVFQPSLRADDWIKTRNNVLQTIAMDIGIDERTLSSSIVPQAEKPTAREISSDENTTTLFVEGKKRLLKNSLDKMLDTVLDFHNFKDEKITIKFSKAGLTNLNNVTTIVTTLTQNGLIDLDTALEMIFTEKNNKQRETIKQNIIEKQEKERQDNIQENIQDNDVEEKIKQTNNQDISHIKKPKKGLFGKKK